MKLHGKYQRGRQSSRKEEQGKKLEISYEETERNTKVGLLDNPNKTDDNTSEHDQNCIYQRTTKLHGVTSDKTAMLIVKFNYIRLQ
jgi:hypothetical protein